jgi:hypothetical protein
MRTIAFWLSLVLIFAALPAFVFVIGSVTRLNRLLRDKSGLCSEFPVKASRSPNLSVVRRDRPARAPSPCVPGQSGPGWKRGKESLG